MAVFGPRLTIVCTNVALPDCDPTEAVWLRRRSARGPYQLDRVLMLFALVGSTIELPTVTVLVKAIPAVPPHVAVMTMFPPAASEPTWQASNSFHAVDGGGMNSQTPTLEVTVTTLLVVARNLE